MQVIAYAREDGVCIVYPTGELPLAAVLVKDVPADAPRIVLDVAELPQDTKWRGAWRLRDGAVAIDMPAARELHRSRIRAARVPLLAALDVALLRAFEMNEPTAALVSARQALRDAPADPAIDAAETPEALASIWPIPA